MKGLLRVAAAVPRLALGNVEKNVSAHIDMLREAAQRHASLVVFPELSLTGSTCGDLYFQRTLLQSVEEGLALLCRDMPADMIAVVGAPLQLSTGLSNCAVALCRGSILSVTPKAQLTHGERRWFRPAGAAAAFEGARCTGRCLLTGADGVTIGVELGSELWSPLPPSTELALAGAEVIVNPAAVYETVGARGYRQSLIAQQSARALCGYVYASAGVGESTSDLIFAGHSLMASCGSILRENDAFLSDGYLMTADIDIDRIRGERARSDSYGELAGQRAPMLRVTADVSLLLPDHVRPALHVSRQPFIPENRAERVVRCGEIFDMQVRALTRRMAITGGRIVIGISGGLDSTLALLVAVRAVDLLGLPRTNILGVTMPCFGTTDWTYQSALELMRTLGVTQREIPIHESVRLHFRDIGHDERDHSVTYENAQARERTQILMDLSNQFGGIVLGTGDLSEIALGWCTYNADHMSMYGVNAGVPKTLVRWVVKTVSESEGFEASRAVLERILDTPISPELLPPDEQGNIAQQTEDLVGPYALHDFFLYYAVRYGDEPAKIFELCCIAFEGVFERPVILKWLKNFYRRFFTQQFKRNCSPDGVKIGSVGLSPRGDWQMPSDAQSAAWLAACEALTP